MSVLVDTNILLRAIQPASPLQQVTLDALAVLEALGEQLCLVPQNLYEFWVAGTRPAAQSGLALSALEAEHEITQICRRFQLRDDPPQLYGQWLSLVSPQQIIGKNAHDARLVAAMQLHGIDKLLTLNGAHFQRYARIVVLAPQDVVNSPPSP